MIKFRGIKVAGSSPAPPSNKFKRKKTMKKLLLFSTLSLTLSIANAGSIQGVGFSGGDGSTDTALSVVLSAINSSKQSIDVLAYSFTSKPIAEALIAAKKRGVTVQIVADANQNSKSYSAVNTTANAGISTRLNGNYQDFHNKVMIIDNQCVELGSFNYSASAANKNAENALVICDGELAQIYDKQFQRWFNEGTPVSSRY